MRSSPGTVLFLSVDRPKSYISKIVERYCPPQGRVVYQDYSSQPQGGFSFIAGLFAPKLLLDTLDHLSHLENGVRASLVVSNVSALTFYNSNDRIREFFSALSRRVEEGPISRVALVMDGRGGYIYNEARAFTDVAMELGW